MPDRVIGSVDQLINQRFLSFFNSINCRSDEGDLYKYERCALLVVDFRAEIPILYRNSQQLKEAGIISESFKIEYATLGFDTFAEDILKVYPDRYVIGNIQDMERIRRIISYKKKNEEI